MAKDRSLRNGKPLSKAPRQNPRILKRKRNEDDIASLKQRVVELDTKAAIESFTDLPLSEATRLGLSASHFKELTDIQSRAIPHALQGRDILGAAKTGSGKTLAFLVPVLENLFRKQWTEYDGLGAMIISPTRELAIQIFEVLRKIGRHHTFSAGLVIGGKSLQEEQERLGRMNILVCTPGRMLQHMDQTAAFDTDNIQMLVLDEADRIMDMGFQSTVDAIVEHLPKERQTMLFSATQTKKVSDLARLSLQDPEYISVHEAASSATPSTLQQHYVVTPLPDKLDTLWSFIRSSVKSKIIVFFSSSKEVRFVYEAFRQMQPGIPLLHLHGRQKQGARLDITHKFSASKNSCLFATDVVARGLDFPAVDWVIQLDCPEDSDTYIHRVGRTARYERDGRAVLFLDPSEEIGMLSRLEQKKIPIEKINIRANKQQSIKHQLQNMCFKDPQLKYLGQKAFTSYVKSIYIQKDKEVFDVKALPLEEFAASLGLPGAPRIKFIKGEDTKSLKNAPRKLQLVSSDDEDEDEDENAEGKKKKAKAPEIRTKYDRMFERRNQDVFTEHYTKLIYDEEAGDKDGSKAKDATNGDDDFLAVKRRYEVEDDEEADDEPRNDSGIQVKEVAGGVRAVQIEGRAPLLIDSNRREKLLQSKKKLLKYKNPGKKLVYDDDGNAHEIYELEDEEDFKKRGDAAEQRAKFLELETERARLADIRDKEIAKQKKREKKEQRRARARAEREAAAAEDGDGPVAYLAPYEGDEGEGDAMEGEMGETEIRPPSKKQKTQGGHDQDTNNRKEKKKKGTKVTFDEPAEMQTLEDLEAFASGLLG
ncbi:ATP-dependent RNA helicase DBP4 [Nannizzia gypsea CBS 118893]|uniref:ATP-dependent RNA helicase n=1 Tax=Arthroderma gypseum (strain ATCC MYA-4604 / CBS 118893) TaxID=535722 RepID=E4UXE9_ARTGP|nr:ATP-dependent RNA helicase DBP4 [Nannizzia gypsea CBS 118893]EFR01897.1 ATP-dependent RNA helicase DBP4 [Nannizzia gypsea CBS 118893]